MNELIGFGGVKVSTCMFVFSLVNLFVVFVYAFYSFSYLSIIVVLIGSSFPVSDTSEFVVSIFRVWSVLASVFG